VIDRQDKAVLEAFAQRVRAHFPRARIWAFGSRSRGDPSCESDFDICIVLEAFDQRARDAISDIAFEVGYENDVVITTVKFSEDDFDHGPSSASALVANILREGIAA